MPANFKCHTPCYTTQLTPAQMPSFLTRKLKIADECKLAIRQCYSSEFCLPLHKPSANFVSLYFYPYHFFPAFIFPYFSLAFCNSVSFFQCFSLYITLYYLFFPHCSSVLFKCIILFFIYLFKQQH